jgi:hypothetical protein
MPLNNDPRARWRLTFACAVTLVALPAMWLLNQRDEDDDAVPADESVATTAPAGDRRTEGTVPVSLDPLSLDESIYLEGDGTEEPEVLVSAAVPQASDGEVFSARATFSSNFTGAGLCVGGPGEIGTAITVTNVNNNRSTDCELVAGNDIIDPDPDTVVLDRATYLEIANASDAPVPVEIRP